MDISREERITEEIKRLTSLFKNMDKGTLKSINSIIKNVAFMTVTLEDLQDHINKNGCVSEYQNGENQWGTKKSPEVDVYNTMVKNHSTLLKQLTDLLPDSAKVSADDTEEEKKFVEFIKGGRR